RRALAEGPETDEEEHREGGRATDEMPPRNTRWEESAETPHVRGSFSGLPPLSRVPPPPPVGEGRGGGSGWGRYRVTGCRNPKSSRVAASVKCWVLPSTTTTMVRP